MLRDLFNNQRFVGALGIFALVYLAYSVSKPFREESDFNSPEYAGEGFDEYDDEALYGDEGGSGMQGAAASSWTPGQSVLNGSLIWNTDPARDPFASDGPVHTSPGTALAVAPASVPKMPRLDALVVGPDSVLAILDDRIVRVGDRHGAFQVTRISRQGVRISAANESVWLPVPGRSIASPGRNSIAENRGGGSSGE